MKAIQATGKIYRQLHDLVEMLGDDNLNLKMPSTAIQSKIAITCCNQALFAKHICAIAFQLP
ncbi:hypothetical protein [Nostoc sp. MG11]|uniref:hypothetical protein n=1 Tax=Nostoc sp. MG11 TaxID=2721166 RepID=UPI0018672CF9|nr:hypothetical protein [Nostoc sp. MG11]